MTSDFKQLWAEPDTPNRERKRMVAHIIEDVTLVKQPREGTTTIHVRFKVLLSTMVEGNLPRFGPTG
jgi:hypothetical protein